VRACIVLLTTALLGLAVTPVVAAPEGQIGIRLLEAPKGSEDDPRARSYILDHLQPGDRISRDIEVSSGLDNSVEVALYAAGAEVKDGTFHFFDGRRQNELAGWTSVDPATVSVAPSGAEVVTATIAIPADAVDGERYGVVWAEVASRGAGNVRSVNRVGIRMYVSIGTGIEPSSDFTVDSLTASRRADGTPMVSALVRNTGQRALDLSGTLQLSNGPGALSAGPFDVKLGTTLGIGQTEPVTVLLDPQIPLGPWDARLTLRSGTIVRIARATVTFPSSPASTASPVPAVTSDGSPLQTTSGRLLVSGAAVSIGVVASTLSIWLLRRRRLRRAR
jgi:hypothetical protein